MMYPQTIIVRHRRENLKKCSLRGLEGREDLCFLPYPGTALPDVSNYVLLKVGAPPLSKDDGARGLLLIDATWRLAPFIEKGLSLKIEARSLPGGIATAYPRRQTDCPDPMQGLASIEALFLAYLALGRPTEGLLDNYYWKDAFMKQFERRPVSADG